MPCSGSDVIAYDRGFPSGSAPAMLKEMGSSSKVVTFLGSVVGDVLTTMRFLVVRQLFRSLFSRTSFSASAHASTKYLPPADDGTVRVRERRDLRPFLSALTGRSPIARPDRDFLLRDRK